LEATKQLIIKSQLHCREWDKLAALRQRFWSTFQLRMKAGAETEFEVNYNVLSGSVLMIID
jgi:hypothetical protein